MTKNEINEGNKLIAEFDELTIYKVEKLKYNESWDWLMPVWFEIAKIFNSNNLTGITVHDVMTDKTGETIARLNYRTHFDGVNSHHRWIENRSEDSPITAVWETVVQFIQWYNKNK